MSYKLFFYKLHESDSCDCSKCNKKETCAKHKSKEAANQIDLYNYEEKDELEEMSQDFCDQKTQKAGDGTKYTYKNNSCEITHCPPGHILDKGTARCHIIPK